MNDRPRAWLQNPRAWLQGLRRWYGPAMFGATVVILGAAALVAWLTISGVSAAGRLGADLTLYLAAAERWISSGGFYPVHQVAGPYPVSDGDILYPPPLLLLLIPFLVLPAVLFWIIPLGTIAAVVRRHRPRPWAWPLMALGLAYPVTTLKIVHGNPVMWIAAAMALGTVYAWPSVLVLLKPSLAPFALIGARRRSWWIALGVAAVLSVPFAGLWVDYAKVALNARSPNGLLYSLDEVPLMLIPVIAWLGRARRAGNGPGDPAEARLT